MPFTAATHNNELVRHLSQLPLPVLLVVDVLHSLFYPPALPQPPLCRILLQRLCRAAADGLRWTMVLCTASRPCVEDKGSNQHALHA